MLPLRTLDDLCKWARRGETYCVLVATQMAMPQRPVRDPRSARQTCFALEDLRFVSSV